MQKLAAARAVRFAPHALAIFLGALALRGYAGVPRWIRSSAPTLSQHNRDVLAGRFELSDEGITTREADRIVATRPRL